MSKHFILMVEDHYELASTVCEFLEEHDFVVDHARNLNAARQLLKQQRYHILLLDINLPDGSGYELCQWLRHEEGLDLPVLMLTARDTLDDKLQGFNSGTDDYLVKPYEFDELLARIYALLRRSGAQNPVNDTAHILSYGDLVLDTEQHLAKFKGEYIELSNREWAILMALVSHPNKIFSKRNLEDKLYDFDSEVSSNTIEVYIHHLRAKLGKDFIRTIRGLGYRLGQI